MTGFRHLAVRAPAERVVASCSALAIDGHVGPTEDRWCGVVVPGDGEAVADAAPALSLALGVPVLLVASSGTALAVSLFVYGEAVVDYRSDDAATAAGAAVERLIDATDARALPEAVAAALHAAGLDPAERYRELAGLLGVPGYLDGLGAGESAPPGFVSTGRQE